MDRELIDRVWKHYLPKEFKEKVKKEYKHQISIDNEQAYWMLERIFGKHNLTSDAEGEEMLMCVKHKVLGFYQEALELIDRGERNNYLNDKLVGIGQKNVLYALFGSKCLPDDKADEKADEKVDEKNSPNADSSEQKPPEPKYHRGEKVRYNGYVYEVEGLVGKNRYALKGLNFDLDEGMIEPYIEPEDNVNLSQETANCDKQFDNILKDSFSKERRLNIAAMAMQGILSNADMLQYAISNFRLPDGTRNRYYAVAQLALAHADALIAELKKEESNGED